MRKLSEAVEMQFSLLSHLNSEGETKMILIFLKNRML